MTVLLRLISHNRTPYRFTVSALTLGLSVAPFVAEAAVQSRLIGALCKVAGFLYTVAIVVGIGAALWAAFQYMTSGGDPNKVSGAHKTLTYAAVGIAVALIAYGVPGMVSTLLGGDAITTCQ